MADFNVDVAKAQGAGTQPLAPVHDARTPMTNPWIGAAVGAANVFLNYTKQSKEEEKQKQIDEVISAFTKDQAAISDAVAQGGISPANAAARARSNFTKYAAAYPQLIKNLKESNSALLDNGDMAGFKDEEQAAKALQRKTDQDLISAGYPVYDGMDPKVKEDFTTSMLKSRRIQAELDETIKRTNLDHSVKQEERAAAKEREVKETGMLLSKLADTHVTSTLTFIQDLSKLPDKEQAKNLLLQRFTGIESAIAGIAATHPELSGNWNRIFADLKKAGLDSLDPNKKNEEVKAQLELLKSQAQLMALADPEVQGLYASNALLGQMVANYQKGNSAAKDILARFNETGGVKYPVVGNSEVEGPIYDAFKRSLDKINNKTTPNKEAIEKDLKVAVGNTLTQVERSIGNGLTMKDMRETANFMASPQFGEMVQRGMIDKGQAAGAKTAFSYVYEQQVAGLVEKQLDAKFRDGKTYRDVLQLNWVGDRVTTEMNKKVNYLDPMELQTRNQLVREMEPTMQAINVLVKAGAHLEGHRDYALYWEENKHRILPSMFQAPDEGHKWDQKSYSGKPAIRPEQIQPGLTMGQFRFKGGDPGKKESWELIK